jgi:glycosyltransferase involved in cell wall biosynthesis
MAIYCMPAPERATMKFSFVSSTKGNSRIIERLLRSLESVRANFEVIIVEQNAERALTEAFLSHFSLPFTYVHEPGSGVSRGRNRGLGEVTGDLVAFPDDDSWLFPAADRTVLELFQSHPELDFLSGQAVDDTGIAYGRWLSQACPITLHTIFGAMMEHTVFFKRGCFEQLRFDESLGPGAGTPWGACEGVDLVVRLLHQGKQGYYFPALKMGHPAKDARLEDIPLHRLALYNRAIGLVVAREHFPWSVTLQLLARPLIAAGLYLAHNPPRSRAYWESFSSRLSGMRDVAEFQKQLKRAATRFPDDDSALTK